MDEILIRQLIGSISCVIIICHVEPILNRMCSETYDLIRFTFWITLVGAVVRLWWIIQGGVPDWISTVMLVCFALILAGDRRMSVFRIKRSEGAKNEF